MCDILREVVIFGEKKVDWNICAYFHINSNFFNVTIGVELCTENNLNNHQL